MIAEITIAAAAVAAAGTGVVLLRRWRAAKKGTVPAQTAPAPAVVKYVEATVSNGARALLASVLKTGPWTGGWPDIEARHDLAAALHLDEIQFGGVDGYEGLHIPVAEPPPPENRSTAAMVAHDRAHKAATADWLRDGARYTITEASARLALVLAQRTPLPALLGPAAVVFVRDMKSALDA